MTRIGPSVAIAAGLLTLTALSAQQPQTADPPRFRVSIDVVRLDAVVTDRNGRVVPDLTADDFEVFQDGKRQKVTYAQFVPVITSASAAASAPASPPSSRPDAAAPAPSTPLAKRESIQRTFAIVIDDLGLSWESLHYAKRALHQFVDRELQPTDLVAIVRTGGSIGGLQPFTTDRRVLHGTIDRLRWNGLSRSGVEAFEALNIWTTFDDRHGLGDLDDFKLVNTVRKSITAAGSLGALNLAIQAARDLPGRKAVIFVSEGFEMMEGAEPDFRVRWALDRAIDQAARAGVVIYSLDARGLQSAGLQASDNLKRPIGGLTMEQTVRTLAAERSAFNRDTQEALAYIAEQTGGFAILNTNDLGRGLGRISDDVRDYYVIGYVPEDGTFAMKGQKPRHHKISVKVRRPGLRVRTRKEFLGISDPDEPPAAPGAAGQLLRAAISPFGETDIELRATMLPGYSPERGTFVRALLHIDARGLTFVDGEEGKKTASADVLGMAFDGDGTQIAHLSTGFSVALTAEAAEEALRDGVAYTLRIPMPRPGAYQVRFAVRDHVSGRLGSAAEFVEIADVARGDFALSGIVLQHDDGAVRTEGNGAIVLTPEQALRVYRPGSGLSFTYEVYNPGEQVQAAPTVWRGTEKILDAPSETLAPPRGGERQFAARGRLKLGEKMLPGSYVLQIAAATPDPKRKGRVRTAVQRIAFDVQ